MIRSRSPLRRAASAAAAAGCAVVMLAGCGGGSTGDDAAPITVASGTAPASALQGSTLDSAIAKPTGVLTDTAGRPYDFAAATKGELALLYFGYTHCPDVCPTTMADISVALSQVPAQIRNHTVVVMVTSDPDRDTPPVLRQWLDAFSTSFVGLTGPVATIDAMAAAVGVSIEPPVTNPDGTVSVTHGAQVLGFSPGDDEAHVVWTAGTDASVYAHDLPLLAAGKS